MMMTEHIHEQYILEQSKTQKARLMDEARRAHLRAEVLAGARQQRQVRRAMWLSGLLSHLRSALTPRPVEHPLPDHSELEPNAF